MQEMGEHIGSPLQICFFYIFPFDILVYMKNTIPIAKLTTKNRQENNSTQEKLVKLKSVIGGFKLGKDMTPQQINKLLDDRYE
jgi:hypothetical protein